VDPAKDSCRLCYVLLSNVYPLQLASAIQFGNCSSLTQKVEKGSEENNVDDTSTNDNEVSN
jgi:hypothetical protein